MSTQLFTAYAKCIIAVGLLLFSLGCLFGTDDPATERAATPDIEGTIAAALRTVAAKQPPTLAPTTLPRGGPAPTMQPQLTPDSEKKPRLAATLIPTGGEVTQIAPGVWVIADPTATPAPTPRPALSVGDTLPEAPLFAGQLLDGSEYYLADSIGTPTLLVFWAPW